MVAKADTYTKNPEHLVKIIHELNLKTQDIISLYLSITIVEALDNIAMKTELLKKNTIITKVTIT